MSDPKATKMTLEEAEKITRLDRDTYADRVWLDVCVRRGDDDEAREDRLDANAVYTKAQANWDRARAIVDQAVRFVRACDGNDSDDELLKLRALERGEGEAAK